MLQLCVHIIQHVAFNTCMCVCVCVEYDCTKGFAVIESAQVTCKLVYIKVLIGA